MYYSDSLIAQVTDTILATRDFCGNEHEAANDTMADLGIPKADRRRIYRVANFRANAEWRQCQKAAGVPEKYIY